LGWSRVEIPYLPIKGKALKRMEKYLKLNMEQPEVKKLVALAEK
jgi:hypothetical protein